MQDKPKEEHTETIKLTKIKDKDKILKATKEKKQTTHKGDFSWDAVVGKGLF